MSSKPVGNLAISLGVMTAADWLARQDSDPAFLTTIEFLLTHGRMSEALDLLQDHIARTAYARYLVNHPEER
jgi:hypothetical protein